MNKEEIGAIQYLQNEIIDIQKTIDFYVDKENIIFKEELKAKQTILSLISKLQKELDKKDKIIESIIKTIKNEIREIEYMRDNALVDESFNIFNGEVVVLKRILEKVEEENEYKFNMQ